MIGKTIVARFWQNVGGFSSKKLDLHSAMLQPERLPRFVQECPAAMRLLDLLGPLAWDQFPERNLLRNWGRTTIPYATFSAACLLKLNEGLVSMDDLRRYLVEHPAFIWLLGFPRVFSAKFSCGFDPSASLPTPRHFTRMLRTMPNPMLQFLLTESVRLIRQELASLNVFTGECVSLDTKHILAWVKENNPKAYVPDRFNKDKQPAGDPDCKLGCKRRHNRQTVEPPTPTKNAAPAKTVPVGEFYWGYGSGVIVVKVPEWGEFVLAEMTQPFDQADVSYFFPLMQQTEQRLGFRPRIGSFDAAFDAFYVYEYFHRPDDPSAFAAVPFSEKGGYKTRKFAPDGLPICEAGLAMPLLFTYTDRTVTLIEHERGKYVCPFFSKNAKSKFIQQSCPIHHPRARKGGCTVSMPTSIGARLRYSLDRQSQIYKEVYNQRSATERINSQAVSLGIERPMLRNGKAIANLNTLIYTLINLRLLQRLRTHSQEES
ncbi:MAG TPA: hypothetical protein VJM08_10925 [Anaerolineales bacterium]|nr:hypothetical protein [Anaerolineales bacterium]